MNIGFQNGKEEISCFEELDVRGFSFMEIFVAFNVNFYYT
jgi:hypothetical protein